MDPKPKIQSFEVHNVVSCRHLKCPGYEELAQKIISMMCAVGEKRLLGVCADIVGCKWELLQD